MGKIVTIVNQKGGVGKTTTCVSLTAALREKGQRVLLCDFDPQANATSGMGVDKSLSLGVYDVLLNDVEPEKRVVSTRYGDVLPSSKGLAGAGVEMVGIQDREHLLRRALERLAPNYDYIFVDCPPSLELLTHQRAVRRGQRAGARAERVLRVGGAQRSHVYHPGGAEEFESPPGAGGGPAHHVRQPDQSGIAGLGGGQAVLPGEGLQHGDPQERAPQRGSQPWEAHQRL